MVDFYYIVCLTTVAFTVYIIKKTQRAAESKHPVIVHTAEQLNKLITIVVLIPFIYTCVYLLFEPIGLWQYLNIPISAPHNPLSPSTPLKLKLTIQRSFGVLLVFLYSILHHQIFTTLHTNWSPLGLRTHQTLVTTGPYAYVRHPMYTAGWLAAIGYPLLVNDVVLGIFFVLGAVAVMTKAWPEEELLKKRFGKEYEEYRRSVIAMFFPGVY